MLKFILFLVLFSWFVVHSLQESVPVKLGSCGAKIPYVRLLFYPTLCSLAMGQWVPKHVGVYVH
jgi:hypothetical protein